MNFNEKVVLVTGGTSGIGRETAKQFASEGAKVIVAGRRQEEGEAVAAEIVSAGGQADFVQTDVTKEDQVERLVAETVDRFGRLDIAFNNAGVEHGGPTTEVTEADYRHVFDVNVLGVLLSQKYEIPAMLNSGGGVIINNSSVAAIRYRQGDILYSALKAAVTHYTKMAGIELGPLNIRVNAISPGAIATPIFYGGSGRANQLSAEENERKMEKLKSNLARAVPLKQAGLAEDIAQAALYLASDAGRFVNCHDLVVDAGRTSMFYEPND